MEQLAGDGCERRAQRAGEAPLPSLTVSRAEWRWRLAEARRGSDSERLTNAASKRAQE